MAVIDIVELHKKYEELDGQKVTIEGWVKGNRSSNKFGFMSINDGTCFAPVQVVYESELGDFAKISKISISSAITVEGTLIVTPEAKQPFEIKADKISLEADSDSDYPLQKKRHTLEFLREIAHLRPRSNTFMAVFRLRSIVAFAIHKFFNERGFVYAHTPIITANDCEGAGELFQVTTLDLDAISGSDKSIDYSRDFFGKQAGLTVSGQLEAEIFALAFKNVYTFGPTFRAENSNTPRHASEFWMIEPEIAFADLEDNMKLAEDLIKYIINYVLENAKEEMKFFDSFIAKGVLERMSTLAKSDFKRVTYTEAIKLLKESGHNFEYPVEWGVDLQTEHERYLTEKIFEGPVFVTDYPKEIKAFYMRMNDDGKTVAACDLLVPGVGEIVGGSQREERMDILQARMKEMGVGEEEMWWYLDLRKYGGVKHAGFGMGFERILMYLSGMSNIRDVIPFPRTPRNAEF